MTFFRGWRVTGPSNPQSSRASSSVRWRLFLLASGLAERLFFEIHQYGILGFPLHTGAHAGALTPSPPER